MHKLADGIIRLQLNAQQNLNCSYAPGTRQAACTDHITRNYEIGITGMQSAAKATEANRHSNDTSRTVPSICTVHVNLDADVIGEVSTKSWETSIRHPICKLQNKRKH